MSHGVELQIDLEEARSAGPVEISARRWLTLAGIFVLGVVLVLLSSMSVTVAEFWGSFLTQVVFWTGLSAAGVVIAAIFQIVRAKWSPPVRRLAEANVAFLPIGLIFVMLTYFGREHLYTWAREPLAGREYWMHPDFVYLRSLIILGALFFFFWRFVRLSLRSDVGFLQEGGSGNAVWQKQSGLLRGWRGKDVEVEDIQRKLSFRAPLVVIFYCLVFSLFAFEMTMSMNGLWYSNMYGGFVFVGNLYIAWAGLVFLALFFGSGSSILKKAVEKQQYWDLGKLTFGFCMLWAYLFFSQFLPQWYGNLPEETQWLILRTREYPWKSLSWVCFSLAFVIPFIVLLSRDVKRTPKAFALVAVLIFAGVWLERYITIMPEISPQTIPLGVLDIGLTLAVGSLYFLSVSRFMSRLPVIPVSHPLTWGSRDW